MSDFNYEYSISNKTKLSKDLHFFKVLPVQEVSDPSFMLK